MIGTGMKGACLGFRGRSEEFSVIRVRARLRGRAMAVGSDGAMVPKVKAIGDVYIG